MNLWNLKAPLYNLFRKPWPLSRILGRETENIQELLRLFPQQEGSGLDIGCGTGRSMQLIAGTKKMLGFDGSFVMAKQAVQNTNHPVVVADALTLPFSAKSFSLITAIGLLEYLDDIEDFFAGCAAVLKPDGYMLVTSSPPGLFTSLRRASGNRINPRKADAVIETAGRFHFALIKKKFCFSQEVFLFSLR